LLLESSCGASSIIPFPSCQTERGFSLCDDQWPDLLALAMQAMQRYYRATSRELRRLDSVSRSHVYTTFTEVLDGSGTIRAFKAQAQFVTKNWKMVATNMEASYSELSASLWLTFRLQVKLSL
jgi:hypothetical protein